MTLRRAARPLRVLVPRRRLAARGARHPRRRARLPGLRAHRPRRRLGGDGVRPGLRRARGAGDHRRRADGRRTARRTFHLTLLVESATGWRNLCRLVTEAHAGTRPRADRDPLPPALALDSLLERSEGLVCLSGCARDGALARRLGARRAAPGRALGRRLAGAFGRRALPGRAAAAALAPRPRPQPRARRARRAARRRLRGDRQRPRPRPPPGRAPGRARRGAPALDARGDRARAARQRELGDRAAGGDGGALRRPPGGGRRDRAARRAAALRPHARPRLPLSRLRGPRRRPQARRALPRRGSSSATPAPASAARRRGASRRSCA